MAGPRLLDPVITTNHLHHHTTRRAAGCAGRSHDASLLVRATRTLPVMRRGDVLRCGVGRPLALLPLPGRLGFAHSVRMLAAKAVTSLAHHR